MSCCDETTARVPPTDLSRRSLLKGAAVIASVLPRRRPTAQGRSIKLAYCSQLLCGVPYEVARSAGHFKKHGLDVELVYTRGGSAAMQALVGNAVDYAATSLDVAITAFAKGADIKRFAVTGRLPLFALVTAPKTAGQIKSIGDLQGRTVAVSGLGNADHALTLYLLAQAKADAGKVKFATMGVNLLEALRQGQIDAGLVQEPALTLLQRAGARVLVNGMDLTDARRYLGGTYEFMGVAVRTKEMEQRKDEMVTLTKALADALKALRSMSGGDLIAALPKEMTTGLDTKEFGEIIVRYRDSLYPEAVTIDLAAAERVAQTLIVGGLLKPAPASPGCTTRRSWGAQIRKLVPIRSLNRTCLRVRDLTISYGGEPVLEGASVEVEPGPVREPGRPVGLGQVEPAARRDRAAEAARRHRRARRQAVRDRHAVPGRRAAAVEDGARQRRARA